MLPAPVAYAMLLTAKQNFWKVLNLWYAQSKEDTLFLYKDHSPLRLFPGLFKDAEEEYSAEWIAESIELAVKNNKRNWKYCEAILRRWKEEGRAEKQDRRDAEKDRRKYIQGEYADYIEH